MQTSHKTSRSNDKLKFHSARSSAATGGKEMKTLSTRNVNLKLKRIKILEFHRSMHFNRFVCLLALHGWQEIFFNLISTTRDLEASTQLQLVAASYEAILHIEMIRIFFFMHFLFSFDFNNNSNHLLCARYLPNCLLPCLAFMFSTNLLSSLSAVQSKNGNYYS